MALLDPLFGKDKQMTNEQAAALNKQLNRGAVGNLPLLPTDQGMSVPNMSTQTMSIAPTTQSTTPIPSVVPTATQVAKTTVTPAAPAAPIAPVSAATKQLQDEATRLAQTGLAFAPQSPQVQAAGTQQSPPPSVTTPGSMDKYGNATGSPEAIAAWQREQEAQKQGATAGNFQTGVSQEAYDAAARTGGIPAKPSEYSRMSPDQLMSLDPKSVRALLPEEELALSPSQKQAYMTALTQKMALEQNQAKYDQTTKETQRQFAEQDTLMKKQQAQQMGLAAFGLARSGSLYTSSQGGLQADGTVQPKGPGTVMRDLQDAFDISQRDLERQRDTALNQARSAFETGNADIALKFLQVAQDAHIQAQNEQNQYFDNVNKSLQGAKLARDNATQDITELVRGGQADFLNDPVYASAFEEARGLVPGTAKGLVELAKMQVRRDSVTNEQELNQLTLESAIKIADLQSKTPIGQTFTFNGHSFTGYKTDGVIVEGKEVDNNGKATYYSVNKLTGEIKTQDLGYIGSAKDGFQPVFDGAGQPWSFNQSTGQYFYAGQRQTDFSEKYPDGSTGGQCGQFIHNFVEDYPVGLNDINSKKSIINVPKGSIPQVGDVVIQTIGGTTGHVAIINSVNTNVGTGATTVTLTESNYNLDEKVSNTRQISVNDPTIAGYFRGKLKQDALVGSDAPKFVPKESKTSDLSVNQRFDAEYKLAKQFDSLSQAARTVDTQIKTMDAAYNQAKKQNLSGKSLNAASQGVLVTFQKVLDPGSVVRETEYARSPEGLSLLSRLDGFKTKVLQGGAGLTVDDLKEFVDTAHEFQSGYESTTTDFAKRAKQNADTYGLDIKNILSQDYIAKIEKGSESQGSENDPLGLF